MKYESVARSISAVWASGVLAYELLHGYPPFLGTHREDTERLIMTQEVQVSPQVGRW